MGFFKKYIGKYGKSFFIAVFFVMIETVCDLLLPTIMSQIIDVGIADKNIDYVFSKGNLMIFITAFGAVAASVRNVISSTVSQKFGAELRSDVYKKIQSFSFEQLNKFDTASLITRLTNDVLQIQVLVNGLMRIFIKGPFLCIGSLIMATRLNYKLATVLAVVVPIVGVLIIINMKIGFPFFTKVQLALDKVNSVIREYLSGVRVVKAFNRFDYEVVRFNKANKEFQSRSVQGLRVMALFGPCIMLTVNFGIVSVLWFGGMRVNLGEMQAGHIIAFINYMTQILFSLLLISMVFNMFVKAKASAERISEVITQESDTMWEIHHERQSNIKGRIDFENVFFSYEGALGQFILKDINFTCMPGETVGIIGATGSGKSSLVNLIPRFYDVTSGCIRVDGEDVKSVNPTRIRDKVAVVPQKTVLFTGTVMENIRWGKEDATMEEIQKAAMIAEAHDFISASPEGYQTRLGQGGVNFSGGQKQRISIARALVREPEILILDDSTSAVDVVTERKIKKSLEKYAKDLTCVIIAQRISSVIDADKIVVLEEGKIISIGKHNELLKNCQVYREIFQSQLGKEM